MKRIIKSAVTEYGLKWAINRSLYAGKIKVLSKLPKLDFLFEKKVTIKRIDLFEFEIAEIENFLSHLDNQNKKQIIELADDATQGIITGFSSIKLNFGSPINWHLNPLTGLENPKYLKWYQINDFDERVGDIKVIWEASRMTHFLYFSRAYILTQNKEYYDAFSKQLSSWIKENQYSYGSNFKCGQEATLRMINVLMTSAVFNYYDLLTKEDIENVYNIVDMSYRRVLSNFFYAHKCIKNNHTFTEILGLIIGSWCAGEDKKTRKYYKLMDREILNQFTEDGGYTQYSFNYQRFTLQILECLLKISKKTNIAIKETDRILQSVLLLYSVQNKDGDVPNYGSNDGALIFPLSNSGYRDFRPVINTIYAQLTGNSLYEGGLYSEEVLWFNDYIPSTNEKILSKSESYKDIGIYKLQNSSNSSRAIIYLQNYKSRPAHMDQLHVDIWSYGRNIFCDNGTFSYASNLGQKLTLNERHNTAFVHGKHQMTKLGPFFMAEWTKKLNIEYEDNYFCGEYASKNGYKHKRAIIMNENHIKIKDLIEYKESSGMYSSILHTPYEVVINNNGFSIFDEELEIAKILTKEKIVVTKELSSLYYMTSRYVYKIEMQQAIQNNKGYSEFEILLNT